MTILLSNHEFIRFCNLFIVICPRKKKKLWSSQERMNKPPKHAVEDSLLAMSPLPSISDPDVHCSTHRLGLVHKYSLISD